MSAPKKIFNAYDAALDDVLPHERSIVRSYEAQVDDVKPSERSVVARIGGRSIDRHRTIIEPTGIDLTHYRTCPVVLFEHGKDINRGMLPVGKNQWIKVDGDRLIAKTLFRDDEFSRELFRAYQEEFLKGWSINVLAHEASPPTKEELRSAPELDHGCDLIYRRTELAEYSSVCIPSHREAISILVSRGFCLPDQPSDELDCKLTSRTTVLMPGGSPPVMTDSGGLESGGAAIRPGTKGDEGEDEEDEEKPKDKDVKRYIKHEGSKFIVYSEEGKHLGEYATKEEAEHRLEQIEYFKHEDGERSTPDDDGPIQHDGHGGWTVRGLEGVSFDSEAMARRALEQLTSPTTFEEIFVRESRAKQARNESILRTIQEDLRAELELQFKGIV